MKNNISHTLSENFQISIIGMVFYQCAVPVVSVAHHLALLLELFMHVRSQHSRRDIAYLILALHYNGQNELSALRPFSSTK